MFSQVAAANHARPVHPNIQPGAAAPLRGADVSQRRGRWLLGLAAAGLVGASLESARLSLPSPWLPLVLGGVYGGCLLLSFPSVRRLAIGAFVLASSPRVQGLGLMAAGLLAFGGWVLSFERQPQEQPGEALYRFGPTPGLRANKTRTAWTDQGHPILLCDMGLRETLPADEAAEAPLVQAQREKLSLIRTAPPCRDSNCHGWVFTGGRYLIDGGEVERILVDNDYHVVSTPQEGDLAIYRSKVGHIGHSAVVRVVSGELVLLESKWGHLGCYLHRPEDYCFATSWAYYRSPRLGHRLVGLEDGPSPKAPSLLTH